MKIRWTAVLAAVLCLAVCAAAADGAVLLGNANGQRMTVWEVRPDSYSAQNENSVFFRAMDGKRDTVYQYVTWTSLAKDEIPEATFLFSGVKLTDLWIRNGRQTDEKSYFSYARIKRLDVTVYTADGASWNWQYRLEDAYNPETVSDSWCDGYQRVSLPKALSGVTKVELWIKGWYKGDVKASQYKVCVTDILFSAGDELRQASAPVYRTPDPTAAPTAAPVATGEPEGNAGIAVRLKEKAETRSGPGLDYTALGMYDRAGAAVTALSAAYDMKSRAWWVQIEYSYAGEKRRGYTVMSALDMTVTQVPVEFLVFQEAILNADVYGYYGPGGGFAAWPARIPEGTEGSVWQTEAGYALFDFTDPETGLRKRVWVPEEALEESNG